MRDGLLLRCDVNCDATPSQEAVVWRSSTIADGPRGEYAELSQRILVPSSSKNYCEVLNGCSEGSDHSSTSCCMLN